MATAVVDGRHRTPVDDTQALQNNGHPRQLECLCGPCNCSLHSCATFGRLANADNRCTPGIIDKSFMDNQAELQTIEDESWTRGRETQNHMKQCRCIRLERYLTKSAYDLADKLDDELLHVLVTRPEIAGKPRDNIVFEGDMDLRTTFETSYEALAKLRLECWKKYQESKQVECAKNRHQHSNESVRMNGHEEEEIRGQTGSEVVADQAPTVSCTPDHCEHHHQRQVMNKAPDDAAQADRPMTRRSPSTRAASPLRPMSNLENGSYIDPDLSSIIVYDSNMNRLERVGLRKRSKYRPSTSLRSSPRGLFGFNDEQPSDRVKVYSMDQQATCSAGKSVKEAQTQTPTEEELISDTEVELESEPNPEPEIHQKMEDHKSQMVPKNQLSLKARNLHNSNLGDTLPVDSRRRVFNNVNMIDHIKEQNIIETQSDEQLASTARRQNPLGTRSQVDEVPNQADDPVANRHPYHGEGRTPNHPKEPATRRWR